MTMISTINKQTDFDKKKSLSDFTPTILLPLLMAFYKLNLVEARIKKEFIYMVMNLCYYIDSIFCSV